MQIFRRLVQISVFLILIVILYVNYYGIKIEQKDDSAIKNSLPLSVIHSFFQGQDRKDVVEASHQIKGSVWTINIFGLRITDPLAAVESTLVALYIYLPMVISILLPVLITIIFGRIYCGWLCPMHLLLELNDKLRGLLLKVGYNSRNIEFNRKTKYFVLIIGLISAFFAGRPLLSLFYPPAVISRELFYKIYTGVWGNGLLIIGTIGFIELILSRRWWCRYICPGGAIYIALSMFRRLRIKRNDLTCDFCGVCNPVCPYDLKPMNKELLSECDSCGLCISVCKPGALKYTFFGAAPPRSLKTQRTDKSQK